MKLSVSTVVAAVLIALAAAPASAQVIQSTFDTDLDGWTQDPAPGPGATLSWTSTGGNLGGYLQRGFGDSSGVSILVAPDKFLGNRSAYNGGTFQWDGEFISGNVGNTYDGHGNSIQPDYGTIRIGGGGLFATTDIVPGAPPGTWTTFSTPLTASAFGVSEADWSTILSNVTSLKFSIEAIYGSEQEGVDNIRMTSPPTNGPAVKLTIEPAVEVSWPSEINRIYQVQWSSPLDTNNWFSLGAPVVGTGSTNAICDTIGGREKRFYRVITKQ